MRIALASDIHLEFGDILLKNTDNADVLILSGDICVAADLDATTMYRKKKHKTIVDFFTNCSAEFKDVIYIMGNHEHYHGDFAKTYDILKENLSHLHNVHVLEQEHIRISDIVFFAGTLWTDMNKEDPITLFEIQNVMNDYRTVKNSNEQVSYRAFAEDGAYEFKTRPATLHPIDTVKSHKSFLLKLNELIEQNQNEKFVVVGHHAPTKKSVKPQYENDTLVNGAYSSDLSEFILDRPQIKLWTHGHTHDAFDYMVGDTRVVCNPRGYIGYEKTAVSFQLKYIDI